ncbi:hypothetical protein ERJ75_000520100 [Trypanosoma vivax]|nr:hypothetical protein ERJ75_000520100 [Trypanosoma vivax]
MCRLRGDSEVPLVPDTVLLAEHSVPVFTVGRRDTRDGIRANCATEVVSTRRGGGVTFHGPGQVTMYPIVNVQLLWKRSIAANKPRSPIEWFSAVLEQAIIDVAQHYGVPTHRGRVGVWLDQWLDVAPRKLGFIGLQLGNWVSMHGAGFNVCNDLRYFDGIVMCEMLGESATSLVEEIRLRRIDVEAPTAGDVVPLLFKRFVSNLYQDGGSALPAIVDLSADDGWDLRSHYGVD